MDGKRQVIAKSLGLIKGYGHESAVDSKRVTYLAPPREDSGLAVEKNGIDSECLAIKKESFMSKNGLLMFTMLLFPAVSFAFTVNCEDSSGKNRVLSVELTEKNTHGFEWGFLRLSGSSRDVRLSLSGLNQNSMKPRLAVALIEKDSKESPLDPFGATVVEAEGSIWEKVALRTKNYAITCIAHK